MFKSASLNPVALGSGIQAGAYMKNIAELRRDQNYICWTPGFNLFYEAFRLLLRSPGPIVLEEIGSTLFATIDKFEKLASQHRDNISERVSYIGVEPLLSFHTYAEVLHPSHQIIHYSDWKDLLPAAPNTVSRSFQATSYAFEMTKDLCDWISRSVLSSQGLWFSATGIERTTKSLGKRLHLFGFKEFVERQSAKGRRVAVYKAERFSYSGDEFIAAWLLVYDPNVIDIGKLNELFLKTFQKNLDDPSFICLLPSGEIREHAQGLDQTRSLRHCIDPTFNFQCDGLEESFARHLAG
jgi:hypothetical protein